LTESGTGNPFEDPSFTSVTTRNSGLFDLHRNVLGGRFFIDRFRELTVAVPSIVNMKLGMIPDAAAQFGNGNCELTIIVNDSSETTDDQSTELGSLTPLPTGRIKSSSSSSNNNNI